MEKFTDALMILMGATIFGGIVYFPPVEFTIMIVVLTLILLRHIHKEHEIGFHYETQGPRQVNTQISCILVIAAVFFGSIIIIILKGV